MKEDRELESKESKTGAKYTEAEWQQMVLGLRRENKENIEKLRKEQDEALFKVDFDDNFYAVLFFSVFIFFFSLSLSSFQIVQKLVLIRINDVSLSWE